jgi:predicted lipoprotein
VIVSDVTNTVVLPTLDDLVTQNTALLATIEPFALEPSAQSLTQSQDAWRAARVPWKESEAFGFGPAADLRLAAVLDQSPADRIDEELAATTPIDAAYVANLGANRKGYHAIEYLLFSGGDAEVLAQLTSGPQAERRRALLPALVRDLEQTSLTLRSAWQAEGDSYVAVLTQPGAANERYPTIKSVVDAFVNESIFLSELIAVGRLGKPLGMANGGTPQPELEESGPSDNSLADMVSNLYSIRNVYFGTRTGQPGGGIGRLVAAQSAATHRAVIDALAGAQRAIEEIPRPFSTAVEEHRAEVERAYDAVKVLQRVLATEVVAVLGSTLQFNDNDGD